MTKPQQDSMLAARRAQAEKVKADLKSHKVCLVCRSVSRSTAPVCPVCHAYQWSTDAAEISSAVDEAAASPFPITLGYAPTYQRPYVFPAFHA